MNIAWWHRFSAPTTGALYEDPGAEFFTRIHPGRAKNRAISQLEAMGYNVTLTQAS